MRLGVLRSVRQAAEQCIRRKAGAECAQLGKSGVPGTTRPGAVEGVGKLCTRGQVLLSPGALIALVERALGGRAVDEAALSKSVAYGRQLAHQLVDQWRPVGIHLGANIDGQVEPAGQRDDVVDAWSLVAFSVGFLMFQLR